MCHRLNKIATFNNCDTCFIKCEVTDYSDPTAYKCELSSLEADTHSLAKMDNGQYYLSFAIAGWQRTPICGFQRDLCADVSADFANLENNDDVDQICETLFEQSVRVKVGVDCLKVET
jgi:hypothetical protein